MLSALLAIVAARPEALTKAAAGECSVVEALDREVEGRRNARMAAIERSHLAGIA